MVIGFNDTYRRMMTTTTMMMMMIRMIKTQNGHNSANSVGTTSKFCMEIDLNDTYRMVTMMIMMIMMVIMMMKMKITNIAIIPAYKIIFNKKIVGEPVADFGLSY